MIKKIFVFSSSLLLISCVSDAEYARSLNQDKAAQTSTIAVSATDKNKTSAVKTGSIAVNMVDKNKTITPPKGAIAVTNTAKTAAIAVNPTNQKAAEADQPVEFFDSDMFDWHLSEALSADKPTVEVKPTAPFTLNQIPQRMDVWMSAAVHEYGGTVETKPDPAYPQSKAIIGELIDLVIQIYGAVEKSTKYSPAEKYNVTVFYKPGTGTVTKMLFTHK